MANTPSVPAIVRAAPIVPSAAGELLAEDTRTAEREAPRSLRKVLNTVEAAAYVGLSPATLETQRSRRRAKAIPWVELSPGRVGYLIADLDKHLMAHRRDPSAEREAA